MFREDLQVTSGAGTADEHPALETDTKTQRWAGTLEDLTPVLTGTVPPHHTLKPQCDSV